MKDVLVPHHGRGHSNWLIKRGLWSGIFSHPPSLFNLGNLMNVLGDGYDICINLLIITAFPIWGRRNVLARTGPWLLSPSQHLPSPDVPASPGIPAPLHTAHAAHPTVPWLGPDHWVRVCQWEVLMGAGNAEAKQKILLFSRGGCR